MAWYSLSTARLVNSEGSTVIYYISYYSQGMGEIFSLVSQTAGLMFPHGRVSSSGRPDVPDGFGLELDDRGRIEVDPYTLDTSQDGVFAIGDAADNTASMIEAIASGRKGAIVVDWYLGGDGEIDKNLVPHEKTAPWLGTGEGFPDMKRCEISCARAEDGINNFCTVATPIDETVAVTESSRCLRCDMKLKMTPVRFWEEY